MSESIDIAPLLAPRVKRFLAYLIDYIPIAIAVMIVFYLFFGLDQAIAELGVNPDDTDAFDAYMDKVDWMSRISFSIWIFYCAVMESSMPQGTLGKMVVGIKVVDEFGQRMTPAKSGVRNLFKILSMLLFFLGFFWILIDRSKQGWHDKIARTYVVDRELFDKAVKEARSEENGDDI